MKIFRFEKFWLAEPSLKEVVQQSWGDNNSLMLSIVKFTDSVQIWSETTFKNIFKEKRILLARIWSIQQRQQNDISHHLVDLEAQPLSEYNLVLIQEKELWCMKSRLNQVIWNDLNTKFLQAATIQRRKRNRIHTLRTLAGNWISDQSQLRDHICLYYQKLFSTDMVCSFREPDGFPVMRRIQDASTKLQLGRVPSPQEID